MNCVNFFYIDKYFEHCPVFLTEVFPHDKMQGHEIIGEKKGIKIIDD